MVRKKIVRKVRKVRNLNDDDEEDEPIRKKKTHDDGGTVGLKIEKLVITGGQFKPVTVEFTPTDDLIVVVPGDSGLSLKGLTPFLGALHKAVAKAVPITDLPDDDEENEDIIEEEEVVKKSVKKKKPVDDDDEEEDESDEDEEEEDEEEDKPVRKKKPTAKKKAHDDDDDDLDAALAELED